MSESSRGRDPVEALADAFLERYRRGERPDASELAAEFPELGADLPAILRTLVELERRFPDAASCPAAEAGAEQEEGRRERGGGEGPGHDGPPLQFWQVGDYRLLREIGRGGMGVVYEAEQLSLGRRVALKILPGHVVVKAGVLARFRREARAAARLHHTNIVPVFEVGRDGDVVYYAMQYIRGRGLDRVIEELREQRAREASGAGGERAGSGGEGGGLSVAARSLREGRFAPESLMLGPACSSGGVGSVVAIPGADATLLEPEEGPPGPGVPTADAGRPGSGSTSVTGGEPPPRSRVRAGGRLPYYRGVAELGRQVAQALAYAHGRGVVHRDIKPSNLLLDDDGVVWVADFGLARIDEDQTLTGTGDLLGTLRYMAPECFRGEGDARADLYALGLTLYELLTLRPAFEAPDRLGLLARIRDEEPTAPRLLEPGLPRDLETIVLKATAKEPSARYASAAAMAEDLGRFLEDRPIAARPIGPRERLVRWCRRKPEQAALAGAVFGLLLLIAVVSATMAVRLELTAREARQAARDARRAAALELLARREVDEGNRRLEALRDALRRNLYAARINAALMAWQANDPGRFALLLDEAFPGPEGLDLLGWEWDYLRHLAGRGGMTLSGHTREVNAVAFSPDGRRLASIQWGGSARVWDAATGALCRELPGSDDPAIVGPLSKGVFGLAYSPDGRTLAAQEPDGLRPALLDAETGRPIRALEGLDGSVLDLAYSPDGRWVAGATSRHSLAVWEAATGHLRAEAPRAHDGPVCDVDIAPDGRWLVTAGLDGRIGLWQAEPLRRRAVLAGHAGAARAVAISPDGRTLASVGDDGTVRLWDAEGGGQADLLVDSGPILTDVAFSPDGRALAWAGFDRAVTVWDLHAARPIRVLRGHTDAVLALEFGPGGRTLASAGADRTVRLWDLSDPGLPRTLPGPGRGDFLDRPLDLAFSPDGAHLVASFANACLKAWRADSGEVCLTVWLPDSGEPGAGWNIKAVAVSPDGRTVAAGTPAGAIVLHDFATGRLLGAIEGAHEAEINDLAFSPDGRTLASASDDGQLTAWDVAGRAPRFCFEGLPRGIHALAFSPDGRALVAGGDGGALALIDADTGAAIRALDGHPWAVYAVAFAPDGRSLASGGLDRTIRLWDAETGTPIRTLTGHSGTVHSLAFSPDGRRLASAGGPDRTVRLWDVASGLELLVMKDHDGRVRRVAFSPDGRRLASAGDDRAVRLRDAPPADAGRRAVSD